MQGIREKLEQLGISSQALGCLNPMVSEIYEKILSHYWQYLCENTEFRKDYSRWREKDCTLEEFADKWKLPAPYKRGLVFAWLRGLPENPADIRPHLVRFMLNLKVEPPRLPEWYPYVESAKDYDKRVRQILSEYKSKVIQVYKDNGVYISPTRYNKWSDVKHQKEIAKMLYGRVIENKRDIEHTNRVSSTVLKECKFWLQRLGFPDETLKRKRGRPPRPKM